jgi:segregation and condensation protein A
VGEDLSYYNEILNNTEENVDYPDIFSQTVSKIFKLVLTGQLDPWSVNISEFKNIFSRERGEDFEIAGILISSAWHVLYEKSRQMIQHAITHEFDSPEEYTDPEEDSMFEDDTTIGSMPDLRVPIMHQEAAKVTLKEFFGAMKSVYKTHQRKIEEEAEYTPDIDDDIIAKSNVDAVEQGIEDTFEKISHYMNPFFVEDYWGNSKYERANFILFLLFLERAEKVVLNQEEPFGNIEVIKLF